MRRRITAFVCLLLFFTCPLSANLIIRCSDLGNYTGKVSYDASTSLLQPRAFALVLSVDNGAVITSVMANMFGESTAENPGFGIFPSRIIIDANGMVSEYSTPVAPDCEPGANGTGLGTNTVVLEFGSLYVDDANAPLTIGDLCTFTVSGICNVSIVAESTFRGGIIWEDTTQATGVIFEGCQVTPEPTTILLLACGGMLFRKKY